MTDIEHESIKAFGLVDRWLLGLSKALIRLRHRMERGPATEDSALKRQPPFRVLTYRDGREVIAEDVETEVAAHTQFASAVDLCKTRDDAHGHRVELRAGAEILDTWTGTAA